jgi:hypothetical protein
MENCDEKFRKLEIKIVTLHAYFFAFPKSAEQTEIVKFLKN